MKLGAFTILFLDRSFEECVTAIAEAGCDCIEIGCGGFIFKKHCDPAALLADRARLQEWRKVIEDAGLEISALSCHANMLHPNPQISRQHVEEFHDAVHLAVDLGVDRVITFAGCPGDSDDAKQPNWVTCPWPEYFTEILNWQWEQKLIPFWRAQSVWLRANGDVRVGLEMHPGDMVYTPEKLLGLRDACGDNICCNFDPSHLFWQQIDPSVAVRALGDAIIHVHVKDSGIDPEIVRVNGVLDNKPYADEANRSWIFRTVGYGHGHETWKRLISTLRLVGYDDVLSFEHEDSLMSSAEGLRKGLQFMREVTIVEPKGKTWFELEERA
jgi:sugar phosphate isomerase/epimerase